MNLLTDYLHYQYVW